MLNNLNEILSVRKARVDDLDAAYQIIHQCSLSLSSKGMENWRRYTKEKVDGMIRSNKIFLLTDHEEIVGSIKLSDQAPSFYQQEDMDLWEQAEAKALYFTALAVSPQHQGKGYGSYLLDFAERYAQNQNIHYLRMTMLTQNQPLAQYYLKKGFLFKQERKVNELRLILSFGEKKLASKGT